MCFLHLWFISCEYQNLSRLLTSLQWARAQLSFWRLTHWGRDKMAAVSQTMISNAFSWMKMYEFHLKFHLSLFLRFQLTIFQHWFRYWLGAVQATSHYLNQWWLVYWRIYASLSLSELGVKSCNHVKICICTTKNYQLNRLYYLSITLVDSPLYTYVILSLFRPAFCEAPWVWPSTWWWFLNWCWPQRLWYWHCHQNTRTTAMRNVTFITLVWGV